MDRLALLATLTLLGCAKKEAPKADVSAPRQDAAPSRDAPAAPVDAAAPATTPPVAVDQTARARALLDAQVAALKQPDDAAITATFAPDAVVLVPGPRKVADDIGLRSAIARLAPDARLREVSIDKLVVGGTADALWLSAEFGITQDKGRASVRVTELATAAAGWKVVAGAFSEAAAPMMRKQANGDAPGSTPDPGPLSALLARPTELARGFSREPGSVLVVFGPTSRADGAAAAEPLVTDWTELALEGATREVRGATWGYAIGYVAQTVPGKKAPLRHAALVIGTPGAGGAWTVVAAHYAGL